VPRPKTRHCQESLAHMITRFFMSSGVSFCLICNPARIHVDIWDQNSLHGLPVDSKLLTSPTHRLAWAVDNRVFDSSNIVWCPWCKVRLSVSIFTIEVMHSPMGSELVDPSVDHWVDRKFTTSEPFCELQLSCVDRLLPIICLNYKYLLLSSPWHLEGQIW